MLYSISVNKNFYNNDEELISNKQQTYYFKSIADLVNNLPVLQDTIILCEEHEGVVPSMSGLMEVSMSINKLDEKEMPINTIKIG